MRTKKIVFRGWRGRENLPEEYARMPGSSLGKAREYLETLRELGFVVSGCPWCFFQTLRGERATCPVCGTVVNADGSRAFPAVLVDGEPAWPGRTSRATGEKMFSSAIERMEKIVVGELLEDAWLPLRRPVRKPVN
jgi:hypothetical protein